MSQSIYDEAAYYRAENLDLSLVGYYSSRIRNMNINTSPVNFFEEQGPENISIYNNWPFYSLAQRHLVTYQQGDCVFIPAYNFF